MVRRYPHNWRKILADLVANPDQAKEITRHLSDEHKETLRWEYQMEVNKSKTKRRLACKT